MEASPTILGGIIMCAFRKYFAEFLGTMILVFVACGTAIITGHADSGWLMTALAFGLVIVAMAYSIGNISGCHINPAVSLAMFLNKKMSLNDFIGYVIAQFAGGIAGALVLSFFFHSGSSGFGTNHLILFDNYGGFGHTGVLPAFVAEVILTFIFVFTILGVTSKAKNESISGIIIGLTLTLVHIIGIGLTGTSVNPARSFGVALIKGGEAFSNVWIFIVAPLIGGAIAALVWKFFNYKEEK